MTASAISIICIVFIAPVVVTLALIAFLEYISRNKKGGAA